MRRLALSLVPLTIGLSACSTIVSAPVDTTENEAEAVRIINVSDLPYRQIQNGWGPVERDMSNGEAGAGDGRSLVIGRYSYPKGLGVHAASIVSVDVPAGCQEFQGAVGIDDEVGDRGSVQFEVLTDGAQRFKSGVVRGHDVPLIFKVSVNGAKELRLVVTNGNDNADFDHADWGAAAFVCRENGPSTSTQDPVADVMDAACFQVGYTRAAYEERRAYYDQRIAQKQAQTTVLQEVRNTLANPAACQGAQSVSQVVDHVTRYKTQLPYVTGATFWSDNWMLSTEGNKRYYAYGDARGPLDVGSRFGLATNRIGISTGQWETVDDAINLIRKSRAAGMQYAWLAIYLKNDCCFARETPTLFRNAAGGITEADLYARVENYVYQTMKRILAESELPILMLEFGNEVDGGFFTDFDASSSYSGPPARIDRTKRIFQAGNRGARRAYAERGLASPFLQLHVMPDSYRSKAQSSSLISSFLSTDYVGEALFDNVSFSYYPNAAGNDPHKTAQLLRDLGDETGLPWFISEMGLAQERAPGLNGWAWNNFTEYWEWCPRLFGTSCTDLVDMQARLMTSTNSIFATSSRFRGSIYLSPQSDVISNSRGDVPWPADQYRFALWRDRTNVNYDGYGGPAEVLPAFSRLKDVNQEGIVPEIHDAGRSCDSVDNCFIWFWGRNFPMTPHVEIRTRSGQLLEVRRTHGLNVETPSVISLTLTRQEAEIFRREGLSYRVISTNPFRAPIPSSEKIGTY